MAQLEKLWSSLAEGLPQDLLPFFFNATLQKQLVSWVLARNQSPWIFSGKTYFDFSAKKSSETTKNSLLNRNNLGFRQEQKKLEGNNHWSVHPSCSQTSRFTVFWNDCPGLDQLRGPRRLNTHSYRYPFPGSNEHNTAWTTGKAGWMTNSSLTTGNTAVRIARGWSAC